MDRWNLDFSYSFSGVIEIMSDYFHWQEKSATEAVFTSYTRHSLLLMTLAKSPRRCILSITPIPNGDISLIKLLFPWKHPYQWSGWVMLHFFICLFVCLFMSLAQSTSRPALLSHRLVFPFSSRSTYATPINLASPILWYRLIILYLHLFQHKLPSHIDTTPKKARGTMGP